MVMFDRLNRFDLLAFATLAVTLGACASPSANDIDPIGAAPRDMRVPADLRAVATPCGVCAGKTPVCDTKTRTCVACLVDADCGTGARCINNACLPACSAQKPCGDAGLCNLDAGVCGSGCTSDTQCKDAKAPFCDKTTGRCVACNPTSDRCPDGTYCAVQGGNASCVPGCKADAECAAMDPSSKCCGHKCIDASADTSNCGACGNACAQGSSCCSGTCLNTSADVTNCGSCGNVCNLPNATPGCSNGSCVIQSCNSNRGDCDGNPLTGCETNLKSDTDNCGRCGKSCLIACVSGSCFPI